MAANDDIAVTIPADLIERAKVWADRDATSIEQFVLNAVEEMIQPHRDAAYLAYLAERAARGSREHFAQVLAQCGGEPPRPGDEIPEGWWDGR